MSIHPSAPPASSSSSASERPVILVVDDYAETRRLIYFYLRDEYDIVEAGSAEDAVAYLSDGKRADLVVMDINFQDGMNGLAATEHIRAIPELKRLPILATSAYAYPDDRTRFLKAGFDDYIAKPLFKERMLRKVRAMLRSGQPEPLPDVWVTRKRKGGEA